MLEITSNGSKWNEQDADSIDRLVAVLAMEPLDPRFLNYGRFILPLGGGKVRFFGNFFALSHVFNITTDDPALIGRLTIAICDNMATREFEALVGLTDRMRDQVLDLFAFVQEVAESETGIGTRARALLSRVSKGGTFPLPSSPEHLYTAGRQVEAWWVREGARLCGGAPAAIFNLREALLDFKRVVDGEVVA